MAALMGSCILCHVCIVYILCKYYNTCTCFLKVFRNNHVAKGGFLKQQPYFHIQILLVMCSRSLNGCTFWHNYRTMLYDKMIIVVFITYWLFQDVQGCCKQTWEQRIAQQPFFNLCYAIMAQTVQQVGTATDMGNQLLIKFILHIIINAVHFVTHLNG